jgi:hypothetical protein
MAMAGRLMKVSIVDSSRRFGLLARVSNLALRSRWDIGHLPQIPPGEAGGRVAHRPAGRSQPMPSVTPAAAGSACSVAVGTRERRRTRPARPTTTSVATSMSVARALTAGVIPNRTAE